MKLTPLPPAPNAGIWTCYGCGCWTREPYNACCPNCGTRDGDGFGEAENDPEWPREADV